MYQEMLSLGQYTPWGAGSVLDKMIFKALKIMSFNISSLLPVNIKKYSPTVWWILTVVKNRYLIMMRVGLLSAMASRLTDKDYVNQFCHRGQHHQQNLAQLIEDKLSASATEAQQDQALIWGHWGHQHQHKNEHQDETFTLLRTSPAITPWKGFSTLPSRWFHFPPTWNWSKISFWCRKKPPLTPPGGPPSHLK